MSVKKRLGHLGHMTRPEPTLPTHEPTLPIHEPLMNHPVPLLTLRVIRGGPGRNRARDLFRVLGASQVEYKTIWETPSKERAEALRHAAPEAQDHEQGGA